MSEHVVTKYGGTSMAQPEVVASVVDACPEQKIVVVSAPGKLGDVHDTKVTDLLKGYAQAIEDREDLGSQIDEVVDRFSGLFELAGSTESRKLTDSLATRLGDAAIEFGYKGPAGVESIGEEFSARLLAVLVGGEYVDPTFFRFTNGSFDKDKSAKLINQQMLLGRDRPIIVPGYYGYDEKGFGKKALFQRGGSDRSGAVLAGALGIDYQNWTDVDGIFSGAPGSVYEPKVVPVLTRDEVREGAHGGNPVLQGDSIIDLVGSDSTINIRNTFNPSSFGTLIVPGPTPYDIDINSPVVAVTGRDDVLQMNIRDLGMANRVGYAESITARLKMLGISLQHMPTSQDSLSLIVHADELPDQNKFHSLSEFVINHSASSGPEITIEQKGILYLVGEALRQPQIKQEVMIRTMQRAHDKGVSLLPIANVGSPSIAFLTGRGETDELVRDVHLTEIESLGNEQS